MPTIRAQGLVKSYGKVRALDGLDLTVEQGTVIMMLTGLAVGWRITSSLGEALLGYVLLLFFVIDHTDTSSALTS